MEFSVISAVSSSSTVTYLQEDFKLIDNIYLYLSFPQSLS